MATAQDIIEAALRKLHVLGKGSALDADEAQDALDTLNDMLATWSAEGNMIFTETIETFNLVSGTGSYTIGSGATFNTTRPNYISAMYVSDGSTDYPVEKIDNQQYSAITQKDIGNIPQVAYYNADYPTATIYLYPVPTSVSTITITSFKPVTSFSALNTTFSMPEEYKAALVYNLAVWLGPEYEREASPTVQRLARSTKSTVKTQNKRNELFISTIDVPADRSGSNGNIYGGWLT